MNLARLRRMTIAEIGSRGRQEALKWLERSGAQAGLERLRPAGPTPSGPLDPARFFAGPTAPDTPALAARLAPEAARALVDAARDARRGRFDLLGFEGLSFGDPIDWHLDPIACVRAPLVHWSRLDVLDHAQVGDSKVPWELNRHQWLVGLGQAYRLTGDESHGETFVASVGSWMAANPRGRGINWASSLEVALRLISWLWALHLLAGAESVPAPFVAEVLEQAVAHASHVERYLSHYHAPNTHLTGEALALLYAGLVLPEAPRAPRWRRLGLRILVEQCDRQIAPDGAYCEQSTCYQRYTAEIYLHAMILGARNGIAFPPAVRSRIEALLDFLLWARHPDGSLPMVGDADGGWLLPLARRRPEDVRGVFSTAAAWFGRPDYAHAAGGRPAPETLWLLGRSGLDAFEALDARAPKAGPSRLFLDGGHAVMRDSWRPDAHQVSFDVGPLSEFGHAHADLLSVRCAVFGSPYLVDAGTYRYTGDAGWRDVFRGTQAHSTVIVDGQGQAVPTTPFAWRARPAARLRRWWSTDAFDFADAEHDGYQRLPDPVVHRRRVLFVKPRYWVVVDDLHGTAEHRLDLRFQFAPMTLRLDDPAPWARAQGPNGRGLLMRTFAPVPLAGRVREGCPDPREGWVSPDYGQRVPAPVLVLSVEGRLPMRLVTLAVPVRQATAPPPAVSPVLGEAGELAGLVFEGSGERVHVDEELVMPQAGPDGPCR